MSSPRQFSQSPNTALGFTLVELITVLAILSVVATIGAGFVATSMESYRDTQGRSKLINRGRQAIEQMQRQLRGAIPNSVVIVGNCVKFLPAAGGGHYLGQLPDQANGAFASSSITTAGYRVDFGTARYASVGALNSDDIYTSGSAIATLSGAIGEGNSGTTLSLSGAKQWGRNSLNRRVFLADYPVAFCLSGGHLYSSSGTTIGWTPSGGDTLLAHNVSGSFSIQSGTESRNTLINFDLSFSENGETVALQQQALIRNVP